MTTFDLSAKINGFDHTQFFPYDSPKAQHFKTFEFDYATPAGNQDALINNLKRGDLVYSTTGAKIKKVEVETPNATLKAVDCVYGFVWQVYSGDWNLLYQDGRDFTEDGGNIIVCTVKEFEIYTNKLTIHSQNAASADTRITLNPAVHATGSAVLEDLIKVGDKDTSNPTVVFK